MSKRKSMCEFPIRRCNSMHRCCRCGENICLGHEYYDGGYGRRAHVNCVKPQNSADSGTGEHISQQPHAACPEGETGRSCETCNYWHDGMCWSESCTDFSEWEQRPASA